MPKLTEALIAKLSPPPGRKDRLVFDGDVKGLGVRATLGKGSAGAPEVRRLFLLQWTDKATGRKRREPLGAWPGLTLSKAREAAQVRLGRVAAGFDPKAEREERRAEDARRREEEARRKRDAAYTLGALLEEWAALHLASRRPRYAAEARRALRHAFAKDLDCPATALDHARAMVVLDAIAAAGSVAMAGRMLAYGRACFAWAVKRRKLAANPFAGLPMPAAAGEARDRVLTDAEMGAVWRAAGGLGPTFGPLVRLLLLTAARREEVAAMRWGELAPDLSTWTLPASRAKNGKAHIVHLSAPARSILRGVPRVEGQDLLFTTTGETAPSGFSRVKRSLDAAVAADLAKQEVETAGAPWRLHDLRRTCVTWLASNGFPPHVADKLLNHATGTISGVAAVYQRAEFLAERKEALEVWGAHVLACGEGSAKRGDKVADLAAARRARSRLGA
ncbi:tyrosine-type recombinase/integrase [Sabulicella glaciei]|uniref:Tyrosine-type recombinase/integrase n=1 Tax=Sabulicella glaciei TaxID=2984948 RepID=A0ABT3P0V1_9PROT|nr:site-specific integrase [Roseococcus sp. MDT2-1-1]MCW8088026.1 tyrosine-type recombinase/integrase [Roseococcus sp. MDT2-1-1]